MEGAIKYVTLNLVSSALFLAAVGILYGVVGTLNMADLARSCTGSPQPGSLTAMAMLFLVAFGIKAAVFPLFFWLPASYHTPPVAVSAMFAGLLTKVGVYALIRVFTLLFVRDTGYTHPLILVLSGLTMVTGVLGAVAQHEFRRVLLVPHHQPDRLHDHGPGLVDDCRTGRLDLLHRPPHHREDEPVPGQRSRPPPARHVRAEEPGRPLRANPGLAVLFLWSRRFIGGIAAPVRLLRQADSRAGQAGTEQYIIVATALVVGLLTLFSMTKIWAEAFWKEAPASSWEEPARAIHRPQAPAYLLLLPMTSLAV